MGSYGSPEFLDFIERKETYSNNNNNNNNNNKKPSGCLKIILVSIVGFFAIIGAVLVFTTVLSGITVNTNTANQVISEADYKSMCQAVLHEEICRNPNLYKGEKIKYSGKVIQILENPLSTQYIVCTEKEYVKGFEYADLGWNMNKRICAEYKPKDTEPRIIDNDDVTVYGEFIGLEKFISVLGEEIRMPKIKAKYIELN